MQEQPEPIEREAWRRALQDGGGEPPRATDERIRAAARRALAPRTGRWWLPASLAASLLLAVMIVQWQYQEIGVPAPVTESDVAPRAAPAVEAQDAEPAAGATRDAATTLMEAPPAPPPPEPARELRRERQPGAVQTEPAPVPRMDLPASSAPVREREASAPRAPAAPAVPAERAEADVGDDFGAVGAAQASKAMRSDARTPEQWYEEIERLRAAGREEEARAELARLEQAHPGWLERHRPERR